MQTKPYTVIGIYDDDHGSFAFHVTVPPGGRLTEVNAAIEAANNQIGENIDVIIAGVVEGHVTVH